MPKSGRIRVYMSFQDRYGWQCQFMERDLRTPIGKKLTFATKDKLVEMIDRGGGFPDLESRLMTDIAIDKGRGGVFLSLTQEQYLKLTKTKQ